ncbi:MAG: hypothetical protein ACOZQL_29015 [Myxococcota bacterium]
MSGGTASSSLLLDELLEAGDVRVLPELLGSKAQKKLATIAQRLLTDPRPFARQVLRGYVEDGCDRPGHRVFVKTIFKAAERDHDAELLGWLAVAFDRLVRRSLETRSRWDYSQRRAVTEQVLVEPPRLLKRLPRWRGGPQSYTNPVSGKATRVRRPFVPLVNPRLTWARNPRSGRWESSRHGGGEPGADPFHFTFSTRRYLQRRTWRFFRRFARQSPQAYREKVLPVLAAFKDEHLASVEALLDSWFLVHALYGRSEVLDRKPLGVVAAKGRNLAQLAFAPYCPDAWKDCGDALFSLVLTAQSRPVRRFAIWALETNHPAHLEGLPAGKLVPLLRSSHDEVQQLGAKVLQTAKGLEALPIGDWLELLTVSNPEALLAVCEAVRKHVAPSRLSLEQAVQLACARAAPVAELGLAWAKARPVRTLRDVEALLQLRHAEAPHVREEGVEWLAQQLLLQEDARPLFVRELLDARFVDVRKTALSLMKRDRRFGESFELWLAMSETPYADVRDEFLAEFEQREHRFPPQTLQRVWATSLLSVHRGNRARRQAARQVADRLIGNPAERAELVKLLGFTLRSVRPTEQRLALAQLVRAATRDPQLLELLKSALPELTFVGSEISE